MFPEITHLDQVLDAIKGEDEFAFNIAHKDGFVFCAYKLVTKTTFPDPESATNEVDRQRYKIRREIRGLVFDAETKRIVSRLFHKFFNVGEKVETAPEKIDLSRRHWLLEKMDGSMLSPLLVPITTLRPNYDCGNDNKKRFILKFRTKMGFNTDTALVGESFVYGSADQTRYPIIERREEADSADIRYRHCVQEDSVDSGINYKRNYIDFCLKWLDLGYTPIFEWCSKQCKIVLTYEEDQLPLLALRHVTSGRYVPFDEMQREAAEFGISCARDWSASLNPAPRTIDDILSSIRGMRGIEGLVLRFDDGQMFKLKTKWYIELHRCKQHLKWNSISEGHVWGLVLEEQVDDTLPTLDTDLERERLSDFNDRLLSAFQRKIQMMQQFLSDAREHCTNKKEYVQYVKKHVVNQYDHSLLFTMWDAPQQIESDLRNTLLSKARDKKAIDTARRILGDPDLKFEPFEVEDAKQRLRTRREEHIDRVQQLKAELSAADGTSPTTSQSSLDGSE